MEIDPNELVKYEDYAEKNKVTQLFEKYLKDEWDLWAKDEIPKRKTIKIYHDLFTLDQQLVSGITEEQIELVWGSGVCVWKKDSVEFKYPLLTRNIGISLNPLTSELTVKASDSEPNVELEWHESQDNPGVPNVGSEAKSFFGSEKGFFTPFDVSNYQSLLKSASAHLDPNGVYWPDEVGENDKELPAADDRLKVTSTWVIFARPRTGNLLLKDLEKLREQAVKSESLPPAVKELVTDPSEDSEDLPLPPFRGVSASYHLEEKPGSGGDEASDLFFPKPFNDEQVRIVQLLDVYNGVVVQGPPGTGKTHTIANVICHYLAMGKRVLVTSMKDPALSVLRNQLPAEIRTLAISLLSTEQDGMKNFEHAIEKIASNVQSINKSDEKKKIRILETKINKLHRTLSGIDRKIIELGRTNLTSIKISGEEIQPEEAAKEVVLNAEQYEWIRDEINVGDEYDPQFTDEQVSQLRNARFQLREDINYHNAVLPSLNDLPEIDSIIRLHQDLKNFDQLKKEVESGKVLSLVDTSEGTIHGLSLLRNKLDELKEVRDIVEQYRSKVSAIKANLSDTLKTNVIEVIQECGKEAKELEEENQAFRVRPVVVPEGVETNQDILSAISKLSVEEKPFGILGFIGHSKEKEILKSITVFDVAPKNSDDWKHVEKFLRYQEMLRKLAIKWNHSATELSLEPVEISPQGGARVIKEFLFFQYAEREKKLEEVVVSTAKEIFPRWVAIAPSNFNWEVFWRLYEAVKHHLAKEKLKDVWLQKERLRDAFTDNSGAVVDSFKQLIDESLGADSVPDADFQNEWTRLRDELNRIHDLEPILSELKTTVNLIRSSGASSYAEELLKPLEGEVDSLLPMNWRECWDLKRLSTHLSEVDKDSDLGDIAEKRREADEQLKRAYQEVIEMKTWLKLSENASDKVKAALQGYLAAIRQIGKGTGKRALRYRHDARMAATDANPAVPCWIMPHWRVSETLPAELGCFDLVIIDEASQSDLTALPALLRAKKVLVVGDDKQVSPEGIGMKEDAIKSIMTQLLGKQVPQYKAQMSPERSIYDLFKVVYAKSSVMLKEHFRCVQPIIEYSKREFYDHELKPLRVPQASERIDPPLVDVFVKDGYRSNDKTNIPEAEYIVDEIKKLTSDEKLKGRSIGIVSLLGQDQSILIWQMICNEIDPQVIRSHDIICGDAYSFQGKERDIMFLSMVADREKKSPLVGKTFPKRFNVAASRARD
ncbi:MAG: AAA domain-containing protein, partial [Flavobacteriaceae bacterium]